jgi:phospholipid/cholesterol/gamma-HCH transport system permease protein
MGNEQETHHPLPITHYRFPVAALINPEGIGRPLLAAFLHWRGFLGLLRYTAGRLQFLRRGPVREVFYRQIYFTGVQALGAVAFIALIAGSVITTQITSLIGAGNPGVTAKILLWTLVRELGPLLSAIVIIARSSAATASELANMRLRGELDDLRRLGIEPLDYLIVPRIAGIALAVVAVTFYFQAIAVVSGLAFTALVHDFSFVRGLESVVALLSVREVLISVLKALVFGLVIGATSCLYGLHGERSITDIPRSVTRAVLQNVLTLFLLDAVVTWIFFV